MNPRVSRSFGWARARSALPIALVALFSQACAGHAPPIASPAESVVSIRNAASGSRDGERIGAWLLAEMFSPGGTAEGAAKARERLRSRETHDQQLYAHLGAAIYDEAHGSPKTAAEEYVRAIVHASRSEDPDVPLVGWYATHHLLALRGPVSGLWKRYEPELRPLLGKPGHLGWRALGELFDLSVSDPNTVPADASLVSEMGCLTHARLAGPFGSGAAADRHRTFDAENAPWPARWAPHPETNIVPHVLPTLRHRCMIASGERTAGGIFYAESYFSLTEPRDLLFAAQGAVKLWVDDVPVLERDLRQWGVWQRFGGAAHVEPGTHRLVARLVNDSTSLRVMNMDGTRASVTNLATFSPPFGLSRVRPIEAPNPLDRIVKDGSAKSPLLSMLAASVAFGESMTDVASVLAEPIVEPENAAPTALLHATFFARQDPAYPDDLRHRNEKTLHTRAVAKDPKLWYSRAWLALDDAEKRGASEAVEPMRALAEEFSNVPEVAAQLARLYGRLGWRTERMNALRTLSARFPEDVSVQTLYLSALDEDGSHAEADRLRARLKTLDPDSEVDLELALARHDWTRALTELAELQKRRPDRKDVEARIAGVLLRAGRPERAAEQLEKALVKNPADAEVRLRLADLSFAKGDRAAIRKALADSILAGSRGTAIRDALDLLDGATALEPYRMDSRSVIRSFEAWEKSGKRMEGTAARVLDYAAVWVHPDGSSEMLEHEIMRIQSQEAVGKESEQQRPTGLVLRMKVIKPNGTELEPEEVDGKPTLTMPHLEVGDYIEIEHISAQESSAPNGTRYTGPHWFFREADKGYWRSEFIVLTPKDKPLEIEVRGHVPPPSVTEKGTFVERRFRVDESPPSPEEPDSPPIQEFLPSVRIGWGISLPQTLARLADAAADESPRDPRLVRKAEEIVRGVPASRRYDRLAKLYSFVIQQIADGRENDPRRVVFGKSGSRQTAFVALARHLGIPIELALVKNRLAMPPIGKMSEVENWDNLVLRAETERGVMWFGVGDKFAPFGTLAAELRGQPAIRLVQGSPRGVTTNEGGADGIALSGRADLRADGSASVEFVQTFTGRVAIGMRGVFDRVSEGQRHDFVETRLLGRYLPGARLRDLSIEHRDDLTLPLVLKIRAEVGELARITDRGLVVKSLFPMHLAQVTSLPERQTPLLMQSSSHVEVHFEVVVPTSLRMPESLPTGTERFGDSSVRVADRVSGHSLQLDRVVDVPAGRIEPGAAYRDFSAFVSRSDALLEREIVLGR